MGDGLFSSFGEHYDAHWGKMTHCWTYSPTLMSCSKQDKLGLTLDGVKRIYGHSVGQQRRYIIIIIDLFLSI